MIVWMPYHWLWKVVHDTVVYCVGCTVDSINNWWNKYKLLIIGIFCYTNITTVTANETFKVFLIGKSLETKGCKY